jgi:restriction endonuclease
MPSSSPADIAAEFGFRPPQRHALMRLNATLSALDLDAPLEDIQASLPGPFAFDTEFPSFCFDMATGIGKTRLLAGCITYLARKGVSRHFFIVTPGETIYTKLLRELEPGSPDYLFAGIAGMDDIRLVSGDDYLYREAIGDTTSRVTVYVFNIQKLLKGTTQQRYKFHTFQETLGASFADSLRSKGDLVVLMDESHRYRGPEYFASINGLQPLLGLEFTATPAFRKNVIYEYPLSKAIDDGWVKKLKAIYRQNDASLDEELDELKLRDGLLLHEEAKLSLAAYADAVGAPRITPLVLINIELIARAEELRKKLEEELGYAGRVLLVHSKKDDLDEQAAQLLELEKRAGEEDAVEIVIHCNKLREGWDVKNIFTIIPLRASISGTLTAQTIGRGVRLPFGVNNREELAEPSVATLRVVCYQKGKDNYARIIEASKQLGNVELEDAEEVKPKERLTVPLLAKPIVIQVPEVDAKISTSATFSSFTPKVMISDEKAAAKLIGVDVVSGEKSDDLGAATQAATDNLTGSLVASIVATVPELKPSDTSKVADIVKSYLKTAAASSEKSDWEKYLESKRRWAREDLLLQIKDHIKKQSKVTYVVKPASLVFKPYDTILPVGSTKRSYKDVPNDEIRASLVGGYANTVYDGYRFDSQQEKWLADALESDPDVTQWLKVPEGQLVIRTPAGRYLPDFIAKRADAMYLIEVKDSKRIEDKNPGVVEKARRAAEWCAAVSNAGDVLWKYRLLRHDRVKQGDTLEGMLGSAVSLDDFIA